MCKEQQSMQADFVHFDELLIVPTEIDDDIQPRAHILVDKHW